MYDLLLAGGTVVDPSVGLSGRHDIAVRDGKIAHIAPLIAGDQAARVIDVAGRTVTPGLIDLHAHVFDGVISNGVHPDLGGVHSGVTTVVDAGSSGCATFSAFPRYIMPQCHTEIIPFLHICQTGLATMPDIVAESSIDVDGALETVDRHRSLIHGIKARMVSPALEIFGMEMPRLARRVARESGTRLMVHIGDTEKRYDPTVIRELLPLLDDGDILTHYFTANPGGVLDANGKLVPEAREAGRPGGVAGYGARAHELQLRRGPPHYRPGPAAALHQHRPHGAGAAHHRAQHDGDDEPLPGPRFHPGAGGDHVHRESGQGHRRRAPPGQPAGGAPGRHFRAGRSRGRVGGLRRAWAPACRCSAPSCRW